MTDPTLREMLGGEWWHGQALCGGLALLDTQYADKLFFGHQTNKQATDMCSLCPVREPCYTTGSSVTHGVWGGSRARDIPRGLSRLASTRTSVSTNAREKMRSETEIQKRRHRDDVRSANRDRLLAAGQPEFLYGTRDVA